MQSSNLYYTIQTKITFGALILVRI